jgi:hypothetical protein
LELEIITEAPGWLTFLCVAAGILVSWLLYRNDQVFTGVSRWIILLMSVLRFITVFVLCLLLLSPLFKSISREVQKPIIALVIDDSKSMSQSIDSNSIGQQLLKEIESIDKNIGKEIDLRIFSTSDRFKEGFDGNFKGLESDLSFPVNELKTRFSGMNLSGVVLVTDGLYNKGADPSYAYPELSVPVFTVGLGDTTIRKDAFIQSVRFNETVFLGNSFPIEVVFNARELQGQKANLKLLTKGAVIAQKSIDIPSSRFSNVSTFILEAKEKGLLKYEVILEPLIGEQNINNNSKTIFLNVTSERSKIVLVHAAPHPDIAAIRSTLESNPNYELLEIPQSSWSGPIADAKLTILHQIPSKISGGKNIVESTIKSGIPTLFILGAQTSISDINNLELPIRIEDSNGSTTEASPAYSSTFSLFRMDDIQIDKINGLPPLTVPFGNYVLKKEGYSLFNQTIGNTKTQMPLLTFFPASSPKMGIIAGEGIWRWKLYDFQNHAHTETFNAIISKSMQYMVSIENRNPFRLSFKNSYNENEQVLFDASVFNDAGESVKDAEISMVLTDENRKDFSYTFSNNAGVFTLNAGFLPSGIYNFKSTAKIGERSLSTSGKIVVAALQSEMTDLVANHSMLQSLSNKTGGAFFNLGMTNELTNAILAQKTMKPIIYSRKSLSEAISLKWLFALIALLLSAEWLMRKRSGSY